MEARSDFGLGCNVPRHLCAITRCTGCQRGLCSCHQIKAEKQKSQKYSHLCTTYYFSPFAVETSGAFGPEALSLLSDIGRLIQAETGEPKSYQFLLQGITVAVQRGNAASIRGTARVVDDVFI